MRRVRLVGALLATVLGMFSAAGAPAQTRGDANCDGIVTAADEPVLVWRIFNDVDDCFGADANNDGVVNAADLLALAPLLIPATPTPTPLRGPQITFFGLATADGKGLASLGDIEPGVPVYFRPSGNGFKIVVEAAPGLSGSDLSFTVSNSDPADPTQRPDLQIEANEPLGDGSLAVCDGGVPAIDPPDYSVTQPISDALNDFACHFSTAGSPGGSCTQDAFGFTDFISPDTRGQYCLLVPSTLRFPLTDTRLTVQLRDRGGNLSATASLIVRVSTGPAPSPFTPTPTATPTSPRPTRTATRTPTPTPRFTPTPTATVTVTLTATATRVATPTASATVVLTHTPTPIGPTRTPTRTFTRTATRTATASPTVTPTPSRTGTSTRTATQTFTATQTASPTVTSTPSPTPAIGPVVTFFGITTGSGTLPSDPPIIENGIPVYVRPSGQGFNIVVEGAPGPDGRTVAVSTFNDPNPPDLQIVASNALGDGSAAVCDNTAPDLGGVPAVNPPRFDNN
ncbi:MAG TPA: hypothetical protein VL403_12100, partial [Candidatus Kryptonia bacterium]|nr:hypothetical protein [Candidatus Kryptonia bacterium]